MALYAVGIPLWFMRAPRLSQPGSFIPHSPQMWVRMLGGEALRWCSLVRVVVSYYCFWSEDTAVGAYSSGIVGVSCGWQKKSSKNRKKMRPRRSTSSWREAIRQSTNQGAKNAAINQFCSLPGLLAVALPHMTSRGPRRFWARRGRAAVIYFATPVQNQQHLRTLVVAMPRTSRGQCWHSGIDIPTMALIYSFAMKAWLCCDFEYKALQYKEYNVMTL